jgi:hypothetical protein
VVAVAGLAPTGVEVTAAGSVNARTPRAVPTVAVSTGGVWGRVTPPPRQCVNTPDHANIALKAMTSKSARLMVDVTKSHAPAKRNTKTTDVEITRRFGRR